MDARLATSPMVIRREGVFDVPAAQQVAAALAEAGDAPVCVDLRHVREFHDFGVVLLATVLAGRSGVSVVGLRQHHVRLLRYLGIETGAPEEGSGATLS